MTSYGLCIQVRCEERLIATFDAIQNLVIYSTEADAERTSVVKALRRAAEALEQAASPD